MTSTTPTRPRPPLSAVAAARLAVAIRAAAERARDTHHAHGTGDARDAHGDRGDVPGWVLVTLMTAGLVAGLWALADTALTQMFTDAMADVRAR